MDQQVLFNLLRLMDLMIHFTSKSIKN